MTPREVIEYEVVSDFRHHAYCFLYRPPDPSRLKSSLTWDSADEVRLAKRGAQRRAQQARARARRREAGLRFGKTL